MGNSALRLEQLLRSMEDQHFSTNASIAYAKATGRAKDQHDDELNSLLRIVGNVGHMRSDLIKVRPMMSMEEIRETLSAHIPEVESPITAIDIILLGMWTSHSRRIYKLSKDLQAMLSATSLSRITWNDINFPFDSFAVVLDEPITCTVMGAPVSYDTLVVGKDTNASDDAAFLYFIALPVCFDEFQFTSEEERRGLERKISQGRWGQVRERVNNIHHRMRFAELLLTGAVKQNLDVSLNTNLEISGEEFVGRADIRRLFRIIAGMCLYFQTLPPKTPHVSNWERGPILPSDRGACITDESEVCVVTSEHKLTPAEHEIIKLEGNDVIEASPHCLNPHFRAGYWHRPRGKGSDATHPKTEWTRPTFVNRHLLNDGELPSGASVIMSPK